MGACLSRSGCSWRAAGASVRRRTGGAARSARDRQGCARSRSLQQSHYLGCRTDSAKLLPCLPTRASTTCRFPFRTVTKHPPITSPATKARPARKRAIAAEVVKSRSAAHHQYGRASRQYRAHRIDGGVGAIAWREPCGNRARAVLRLGTEEPRHTRCPRASRSTKQCVKSRCCGPSTMAGSSSMRWSPTTTRVFQNPASAVGAAARSTSRRRGGCFRVTLPKSFRVLSSGMCASIRSPTSGALRRHFWHSVARTGCRSLANRCARRDQDFGGCRCQAFLLTGDARAADPVCHLSPHHALVAQLAAERKMPPTATEVPDCVELPAPDCNGGVERWRLVVKGVRSGAILDWDLVS